MARLSLAGVISAIASVLLFAYAVHTAGLGEIADGIRKVGLGFLWVLLFSAIRQVVRTLAWMACVEEPAQLSFRDAFAGFVAGDAVGNLTPFGPLASEGTKVVFVRPRLAPIDALSSIALENIFYGATVVVMIALGTGVFLSAFRPNEAGQAAGLALIALAAAGGAVVGWLLYRQPRFLSGMFRWITERRSGREHDAQTDWLRALEERIYGFAARQPQRVAKILFFEIAFHAAAIAEIYVLLLLLVGASGATWLLAIVLETVNRLITVAFKFIPLRLGIDEAGSGLATQALALGAIPGVTMALVRKARVLCWTAVGVAFLLQRGLSLRRLATQAETAIESSLPH